MPETPAQPGAALELRNLVKRYGSELALRGISMGIEPGEFVTLLGPSGSGKTTTLSMIAGFVDVTEGDVLMNGKRINEVPTHKRDLGMIFQSYALFPHMTITANVAYPLKQRKTPKREIAERVEGALELVGLGGLGQRYPRQLSGGQQQRVAFARAIVFNPRILLMDEPLGALDRKLRESLQIEIKRIHRELGITFVYVTHDQEEALALSDRIAVFRDGVIEQVGAPDELYMHPKTLFVGEFIGESNRFPGVVEKGPEGCTLECDRVRLRVADSEDGGKTLLVRPEKIVLVASEDAADNVLPGLVTETVYLGPMTKLQIRLETGREVILRERASLLAGVGPGDRVSIGWNVEDGVLLAPAADAEGVTEPAGERSSRSSRIASLA